MMGAAATEQGRTPVEYPALQAEPDDLGVEAYGTLQFLHVKHHVTKTGDLAGPKVLEHMVDTVLYFEGSGGGSIRMVRAVKNRFGTTGELAVMEMRQDGLVPVADAGALFLGERDCREPGAAVCAGAWARPVCRGVCGHTHGYTQLRHRDLGGAPAACLFCAALRWLQ